MKETSQQHYDKMTKTPVSRLIIRLCIPTIISMLITNIYNLADTYFVGALGISQSGAIGVVFTLMSVLQAVGFMLGHGAGSVISRLLATSNVDKSSEYASTSFILSLVCGMIFAFFGIIFIEPFMELLGSSKTILPYAKTYATYILISSPFLLSSLVMNNILRYEGKAIYAMIGLSCGGILNIIGDPIFINVFNMSVGGAGLSTAISQFISFIILFILFKKNAQCRLSFHKFSKDIHVIFNIIKTGFPSLLRQGLTSISSGILNNFAQPFGDECISGLSIVSRCQGFMLSIGIGIGQGFQPVAGFNYQAGKYKRVKQGFYFTTIASIVILAVFSLIGFLFAPQIIYLFQSDAKVIEIGSLALKFTSIGLIFLPISATANMLFQSIGYNGRASFLACLRAGICYIPLVITLSMTLQVLGLQMAQGIADILACLLTLPFIIQFFKKLPKEDKLTSMQ